MRRHAALVAALMLSACTSTLTKSYVASGAIPLCPHSRDLGRVAVLPETAWRDDQKEPDERTEMAAEAIAHVLSSSRCGEEIEVQPFGRWSSELEAALRTLLDGSASPPPSGCAGC